MTRLFRDHAARDPVSGVAGRVSFHVVRFGVDHQRRAAVRENRVISVAHVDAGICHSGFRLTLGIDREILHVACMVPGGVVEAVLFLIGIEVAAGGGEGRFTLGILVDMDGVFALGKVHQVQFDGDTARLDRRNDGLADTGSFCILQLDGNGFRGSHAHSSKQGREADGTKSESRHGNSLQEVGSQESELREICWFACSGLKQQGNRTRRMPDCDGYWALPRGIPVSPAAIDRELWRRQQGFGRGGRMKIETDRAHIVSGVRHSKTIGSPVAMIIQNKDWQNWTDSLPVEDFEGSGEKKKPVTKPRPGHADLAGAIKYDFPDARYILERASARETYGSGCGWRIGEGFAGGTGDPSAESRDRGGRGSTESGGDVGRIGRAERKRRSAARLRR